MKNGFKCMLSGFMGLLIAMQGFVLPVQADDGDIQTIFDLSDMYTTGNIYNKDPLYSGGNAGYAGAWYYNDFISDKSIKWKTPWSDGMKDNILTTANGVDFKLRVVEGSSANCVLRNRSDSNVYTNLDVSDGAYTEVDFLVTSDRASSSADRKYIGVKLNYADGTSDISETYLNFFSNKPDETATVTLGVESRRCRNGEAAQGYLSQVMIKANPEKELLSIDIINDRFEWMTDSSGNYVIENGEYKTSMHASANSRGKYKFVTQIYAVTLITNEEVVKAAQEAKIKKQIAEIEDSITALGSVENLQYSQRGDVEKIGKLIETAKKDGIDVEEKVSNYSTYLDAVIKMEELYRDIVYKEINDAIEKLGPIEELKYSQKEELEAITLKIEDAEKNGYKVTEENVSNLSIYEAALVRMDELYIETVLKEIEDKIIALGDINSLKYEDQSKLDEIAEMISSAETEGIEVNSESLVNYDTYIEAQRVVKDLMPVSVPVDISTLFNVSNIYGPNGGSVTGSAGYAGRIVYQSMINDLEWKYEWDEERIDNITTVNGVNYQIILDFSLVDKNGANLYTIYEEKMSEKGKIAVIDGLYGKNLKNIDELLNKFAENVFINAIKCPELDGTGHISEVLTKKNADAVGISVDSYLNIKNNTQKKNTELDLMSETFATVKELEERLPDIVSSNKQQNGGSFGGGSGGGGSSMGGMGSLIVTPIENGEKAETENKVFLDMADVSWAEEAVNYLYKKGIVSGTGNNMFSPQKAVTREQFAVMLINSLGTELLENDGKFSDVLAGSYYEKHVATGVKSGIINGISENVFGIGKNITREDLCTLIFRAYFADELSEGKLNFSDNSDVSDYALTAVSSLADKGIVNGFSDGTFRPKGVCTRAQAAKMLYGAMKFIENDK